MVGDDGWREIKKKRKGTWQLGKMSGRSFAGICFYSMINL